MARVDALTRSFHALATSPYWPQMMWVMYEARLRDDWQDLVTVVLGAARKRENILAHFSVYPDPLAAMEHFYACAYDELVHAGSVREGLSLRRSERPAELCSTEEVLRLFEK